MEPSAYAKASGMSPEPPERVSFPTQDEGHIYADRYGTGDRGGAGAGRPVQQRELGEAGGGTGAGRIPRFGHNWLWLVLTGMSSLGSIPM